MEDYTPTMTDDQIKMCIRVQELVAKKFEHRLCEPTIVTDVMGALHAFERTPDTEVIVKDIVFSKLLMKERFL